MQPLPTLKMKGVSVPETFFRVGFTFEVGRDGLAMTPLLGILCEFIQGPVDSSECVGSKDFKVERLGWSASPNKPLPEPKWLLEQIMNRVVAMCDGEPRYCDPKDFMDQFEEAKKRWAVERDVCREHHPEWCA